MDVAEDVAAVAFQARYDVPDLGPNVLDGPRGQRCLCVDASAPQRDSFTRPVFPLAVRMTARGPLDGIQDIEDDLNEYELYPVIAFGIAYRF